MKTRDRASYTENAYKKCFLKRTTILKSGSVMYDELKHDDMGNQGIYERLRFHGIEC